MSRADSWIRGTTAAVVTLLAIVAGIVSYRHALEVVRQHGETGFTAFLVPATVDGLIYASSMVLLDAARRNLPAGALARWTLALGILATLAANVAHGLAHGVVGAIVAAWPAVALVLAYETLMALIRRRSVPVESVAEYVPERVLQAAPAPVVVPAGPVAEESPVEDAPEVSAVPEPVLLDDPLYPEAVKVFFSDVVSGEVPRIRAIKKTLNVGQDKAVSLQAYLRQLVEA